MNKLKWFAYLFIFPTVFLLPPADSYAKTVTVIKEYTYQASEVDSKVSSRAIALESVKRNLLEELGTYVVSETTVKDFQVIKDQIKSYSSGIVKVQIKEERWDGKYYYVKAIITADTDELINKINDLNKDPEQSEILVDINNKMEEVLNDIENLKKSVGIDNVGDVDKKKYEKSIKELEALDWVRKGQVLHHREKDEKAALKAVNKAIEIYPNLGAAYSLRAGIYNSMEMFKEGLSDSEKAMSLGYKHMGTYNAYAKALMGIGRYSESLQVINKSMELHPERSHIYCTRSEIYFHMDNQKGAMEDANTAINLDPKYYCGYVRKGRVLMKSNEMEEAIKNFDKAIELFPKHSGAYYHRGRAYWKIGDKESGLEDIRKAAGMGIPDAQTWLMRKGY